jgi:hypothetical protein
MSKEVHVNIGKEVEEPIVVPDPLPEAPAEPSPTPSPVPAEPSKVPA